MGFSSKSLVLFVVALIAICNATSSTATTYNVGWNIKGDINYAEWASSMTFHVGDTIRFIYDRDVHNVVQVSLEDYISCTARAPLDTFKTGNDSIRITGEYDHYYFISGIPGHCDMGLKFDFEVAGVTGQAPATSPPRTHPSPPAPTSPAPPKSSKSTSPPKPSPHHKSSLHKPSSPHKSPSPHHKSSPPKPSSPHKSPSPPHKSSPPKPLSPHKSPSPPHKSSPSKPSSPHKSPSPPHNSPPKPSPSLEISGSFEFSYQNMPPKPSVPVSPPHTPSSPPTSAPLPVPASPSASPPKSSGAYSVSCSHLVLFVGAAAYLIFMH
ncbi:hypothetical protein MKW94_014491 [Papaver nudicaule]|uniref:Phytocyanin domain-containing protein n=1 Tax=Papaver nudicaule TaxID=74823 RepID=A0AA42B3S7_PAPNU|nr:hypothetical protein [Papaver nudicaule]